MPWDADVPKLGFSSGAPWLPLGAEHCALAVSAQEGNPYSSLAFVRERVGEKIICVFNLGAGAVNFDLPGDVTPLDVGTGRASLSGRRLTLGPFSAFFGRL